MNKIVSWMKGSNRWKHLLGGFVVGLLFSFPAALGCAGAMEYKDWQWGGRVEAADFLLTAGGGLMGGALRLAVVLILLKTFIL